MNTTLLEQPDVNARTAELNAAPIEVLQYRSKKGGWLLDMIIYGAMICGCILLTGNGFFGLVAEGIRPIYLLLAFGGTIGTKSLLNAAVKCCEFYKDNEPKLTLSNDAICDHRTDLDIEFMDAKSIFFDHVTVKGNDARANLQLTMNDETLHIIDLRQLDTPVEEIARQVIAISGLKEDAETKTTNPRQDFILWIMGATMLGLLALKVVCDLCGV